MGEYEDKRVIDVVDEINEKYFLPHIQRPFVWKEEQIQKLFDSLLRGYPIGTFLFWTTMDAEVRRRKFIENFYRIYNNDFNIQKLGLEDTVPRKDFTLVLDGQQRLQSLFVTLRGKYEDRELFFDILSGTKENEEGVLYKFDFFKTPPKENQEALWIKAKDLLDRLGPKKQYFTEVTDGILTSSGVDSSKRKTISENVERFYRALVSEKKITYYPEMEESPERVFDIFVRVNSGGTQLSKSDLLFSFIKLKWKKFEAEKAFPTFLEKINGNWQFDFDIDFILKTSIVLLDYPARYTIKSFTGDVGNKIAEKIEENWLKIMESIASVVDLIRDDFRITNKKLLPSNGTLIPIIYYAHHKNKKSKDSFDFEEKKTIRNWLMNALLCGSFSGHSDNALEKARKTIKDHITQSFPAKEINAEFKGMRKITEINLEILKDTKYANSESFLLLYLLYPYDTNFTPSSDKNYPEQDHIFSSHELETLYAPADINRVGNIRLVTLNANRRKSDTPYKDWIKGEKPKELELTLIPGKPEDWNVGNYTEFVQMRETKILEKVKEAL